MFTYNPNNLYANFLDFLNPTKIFKDSSSIDVKLDENNQLVSHQNLSFSMITGRQTFPICEKVQILAKLEMAFHSLNSKITEEFPELNGEKFIVILEKIKEHFGGEVIIPQCYELIRIIRNKFQHDKSEGLIWEENNLVLYDKERNRSLVITFKGLEILVYLIWYSLKNNINHLYNKIFLNKLYVNLKKELKEVNYKEKNKKGEVNYEFNGLENYDVPWNTYPLIGRTLVNALKPEKKENNYILRRLKCFQDRGAFNRENDWIEIQNVYIQSLDYYFEIDNEKYLIPDEFFYNFKDGEDAIISLNDLQAFKYLEVEIAKF